MKIIISTLISLILVGCSACGKGPNHIVPEIQPIYDQFISDAHKYEVDLPKEEGLTIDFSNLRKNLVEGIMIGSCSRIGYGGGTIKIDYSYWQTSTDINRQILVYHELGHCVLNEKHTSNRMAIMNPIIDYPLTFENTDLDGMIEQLFFDLGDNER